MSYNLDEILKEAYSDNNEIKPEYALNQETLQKIKSNKRCKKGLFTRRMSEMAKFAIICICLCIAAAASVSAYLVIKPYVMKEEKSKEIDIENRDYIQWEVKGDTLIIWGRGDMDYYYIPWGREVGSVKKIVVKEGVTSICEGAFASAYELENVEIAKSVERIEKDAFCTMSKWFKSSLEKNRVIIINDILVCDDSFPLYGQEDEIEEYKVPDGIRIISAEAFMCNDMQKIEIPSSVKVIEEKAFYGCENLKNIIIPEGVVSMGDRVFSGCTNLETVTLPESLEEVGEYFFEDCPNLKTIYGVKGSYGEVLSKYGAYEFETVVTVEGEKE